MRSFTSVVGLSCAMVAVGVEAREADAFGELHARAQEVEKNLVTLRADFVETTESDLLAEPIVETGTMIAARPMRVLFRYQRPERKTLFIDGNELRIAWLDRGEVETLPIGEIQRAVDKYFYRSSEKELRSHFDVEVVEDPELPGTHLVDMIATRKQVKEGIERLQLWIAADTLYPVKMRFVYPAGAGSKMIELSNLRANAPIDDDEFRIELSSERTKPPRGVGVGLGSGTVAPPLDW